MRTLRFGSWAMVVTLWGCGGAPAPKPEAPAPATEATPDSAEADAESTEEAGGEVEVDDSESSVPRAKILAVQEVPGKSGDRRVRIRFMNPTPKSCTFTAYTFVWPGGRKTIEQKPFEIPPGGSRLRNLRLHASDGDFSSLKTDSEVEVNAGCADVGAQKH
jgi:hypothetical protein